MRRFAALQLLGTIVTIDSTEHYNKKVEPECVHRVHIGQWRLWIDVAEAPFLGGENCKQMVWMVASSRLGS